MVLGPPVDPLKRFPFKSKNELESIERLEEIVKLTQDVQELNRIVSV